MPKSVLQMCEVENDGDTKGDRKYMSIHRQCEAPSRNSIAHRRVCREMAHFMSEDLLWKILFRALKNEQVRRKPKGRGEMLSKYGCKNVVANSKKEEKYSSLCPRGIRTVPTVFRFGRGRGRYKIES